MFLKDEFKIIYLFFRQNFPCDEDGNSLKSISKNGKKIQFLISRNAKFRVNKPNSLFNHNLELNLKQAGQDI
jgi:hypothetical protein